MGLLFVLKFVCFEYYLIILFKMKGQWQFSVFSNYVKTREIKRSHAKENSDPVRLI